MATNELSVFDPLRAQITLHVAPFNEIVVTDAASANRVADALRVVKGYLKELDQKSTAILKPMKDQVKFITSYVNDIEAPLIAAEKSAKAKLAAWEDIQERHRQEERRKEQERLREIQRAADAERDRINAEIASKQRAEREALAEASEAADLFGSDDVSDPLDAKQAMEASHAAEAAQRQAQIDREAAVRAGEARQRQYDIEATRLKGTTRRWKAEATDLSKVPREYLKIELNNAACLAAARGGITEIPGVRLWQETDVSVGAHTRIGALT